MPSSTTHKHPKLYSQKEVLAFLDSIGLGHLAGIFKENTVDGPLLVVLTDEDLKNELGFTNLQARKFRLSLDKAIGEAEEARTSTSRAGPSSSSSSSSRPTSTTARATPAMTTRDTSAMVGDELTAEDLSFDEQAEQAIPADVRMISGCHETQTSADVNDVGSFQLPDPAGQAGGACTSAILQVVYKEHRNSSENLTFMDVFLQTRDVIKSKGFKQIPQLSSSRRIDVNQPFNIMSNKYGDKGTRYAVIIGINYTSHKQGRLNGCHNDVHNIKRYVMDVGKIKASNITVLMDDGRHTNPTKANIMKALGDLTRKVKPGDTAFVHYSGHGSRVKDMTGREKSGYNSTIVPVDFDKVGQIIDDELYEHLVCAMPRGTTLTCLMDCCHSGTVLDLPYNFVADGEQTEMVAMDDFPFVKLLQLLGKALRDAGVERLGDLRDRGKRQQVKAALADNVGDVIGEEQRSMENNIEGLRRDLEKGDLGAVRDQVQENRKARQEKRQARRKMFRG